VKQRRVLLLEDREADATRLTSLLREVAAFRYEVDVVPTLSDALEQLDGASVDVIMAGLDPGHTDGEETIRRLASAAPTTPVVVLSNADGPSVTREALEHGAFDCLAKTDCNPKCLERILRHAFAIERRDRALREGESIRRSIVRASPAGIGYIRGGKIVWVSVGICNMLGCAESELIGKSPRVVFGSDGTSQRIRSALQDRAGALQGETTETTWRRKDGRMLDIDLRVARVELPSAEGGLIFAALDVTEQKRAEAALQQSEAAHRQLVELAPFGVVSVSLSGTIAACNSRFAEMADYEKNELVGRHFSKLEPARVIDLPRYARLFGSLLAGKTPKPFDARWTTKAGSLREGHVRVALIKRNGKPSGIHVTVEDITEQRRMETFLRLTQHSIDSTDVMVLWMLEDGRLMFANDAACRRLAYDRSELKTKSIWDIDPRYPADERSSRWRDLKSASPETSEQVFRDQQGNEFPVEITAQHIEFHGEAYEFVFAVDITERKRAEAALRDSEARYRSLFENAVLGIYRTSPDGHILAANPALVRMLGYASFEELAKRNLQERGYEPETPRALFKEQVERDGNIRGHESAWTRRDGSTLYVRENAQAVRGEDGRVLYYEGTIEDITERRRLQAHLQQSQRLEAIGTLASGIAHEINNPLMGMVNYADLIASRTKSCELKRFAEEIQQEGHRIAGIVRNLLAFARKIPEASSLARILDLVDGSMLLIGSLLEKDHIIVVKSIPDDLPRIRCRSQEIQQAVTNLMLNARDGLNARYPGFDESKRLTISAAAHAGDEGQWLRLTVEDSGVGIAPERIERIFDPFYTTKPRNVGTGLGLSISFSIVRDHGGRLTAESEEGVFSRFHIDLPVADDA